MLISIICPGCGTEGKFSIIQSVYQGPYKCWKCREIYAIRLENNKLVYCQPLSPEDYAKFKQEEELRRKH